ncbi:MAG: starch-binding protein [Muribaculaceae bacterium]|nr:starch-binding protein [Muribaculaceae bacterium]
MKKSLRFLIALVVSLMTLQAGAAMYIVGSGPFGEWQLAEGVQMADQGNGTYSYSVAINGTVYFVFADGLSSSWDTFNSSYRYGPSSGDQNVAADTWVPAQKAGDHGAYYFTGDGSEYEFIFDANNKRFKITGNGSGPVTPTTGKLYMLGEVGGNSWAPNTGVEMSSNDGNTFTAQVTFNGEHSEEDANVSYFSFTTKLAESSSDWEGIRSYRLSPIADEGTDFWVTSSMLGNTIQLNPMGVNIDVAFRIPAGTYTITVNVSALTCVITRDSGGGTVSGKGWPSMYGGVMLQGFYWDSYNATRWTTLTEQAQDLGQYFDVVWVPNSGSVDANGVGQSMGYMPVYWLKHNSCFGTEQQLRDMISTFHNHNTSVLMDMVINHKSGKSGWVDFANETVTGPVTGEEYKLTWTLADICRSDECVGAGYAATGANDEGEDFDGSRDLDHTSANVQKNVKTYQQYLMKELGYDGFRYDMCKGYAGYYVGLYNKASEPTFSVSEYWDGNPETLRWWLNETKQDDRIQTAVFDFALKYPMQSAFASGNWSALNDKGLAADPNYQRYSVTFVDNHDTGQNSNYDCLKTNIMPANAFILAMPGTPCIFYKHYLVYTDEINNCIKARRAAGVHNQSAILTQQESNGGYILETQGTRGNLYLQVGGAVAAGCPYGYETVQTGDGYALYITYGIDWQHVGKDGSILGYPVVSKAAGNYVGNVSLTVAPSKSGTTLVYTIDGSEPTTSSTAISASTNFTFNESTTLKVGVLNGDQVENIESYVYTITDAATTGINVYVKSTSNNAHIWAWTSEGSVTGNSWPGKAISSLDKVTLNDIEWYCLHVDADHVSVIFNNGDGGFENQTSTINVTRDAFFIYPNNELSTYGYSAADTYLDMTERYAGAGSASFEKVYVLGNINQTGWAPNNGIEMTTTNGEKYTATIDFVDPYGGYSYFSFSTALATNADDWDAIASCRMGATSKDQLISQSQLGQELNVVAGQNAFRIATGKYNLTLYLTGGKLVVEKWTPEPQVVRGDVDMDGEVNVGDITALIDWMLGNHTMPVSTTNADTDLDGVLTIGDVTRLIDYMLNGRW